MMNTRLIVCLLICACADKSQPPATSTESHHIAMVSQLNESAKRIAFLAEENREEGQAILDGQTPKNFYWVAIDIPSESASGSLTTDLTDKSAGIVFQQVYPGQCNPALNDTGTCALYEIYRSGDVGLTGRIVLGLEHATATANIEISWQGITDRFGSPAQLHQHSTSGNYAAPIVGGAP